MPFMSDLPQYGMAGLPFSTGPQNGHSSSMDSTPPTFQYQSDAGFPLLPPYVPRASRTQDALSTEGMYQRFGDIARNADGLPLMAGEVTNPNNNPCKLIFTRCLSHANNTTLPHHNHSTQHITHQGQMGNRTESSNSTQAGDPTRTMCQGVPNPCTRHRPSGGHVHDAALSSHSDD
jgi:hypothetical protein